VKALNKIAVSKHMPTGRGFGESAVAWFLRIWPPATIIFALIITAAWISYLGYQFVFKVVSLIGL
jgi:hypothetical protein